LAVAPEILAIRRVIRGMQKDNERLKNERSYKSVSWKRV
jgi:hypothetical protein